MGMKFSIEEGVEGIAKATEEFNIEMRIDTSISIS
jgi:hypothetical protein